MARDIFDEFEAEYKERVKRLSFGKGKDSVYDKKEKSQKFLDIPKDQSSHTKRQAGKKWRFSLFGNNDGYKDKAGGLDSTTKGVKGSFTGADALNGKKQRLDQDKTSSKKGQDKANGSYSSYKAVHLPKGKGTGADGYTGRVFDSEGNPTKEFIDYAVEDVRKKLGLE